MTARVSMKAISAERFGFREAKHLLNRAGFGGTAEDVERLVKLGPEKAVGVLVDYQQVSGKEDDEVEMDADLIRPLTKEERLRQRKARQEMDEGVLGEIRKQRNEARRQDRKQMQEVEHWWLRKMATTTRPTREKLTLLWHSHFAANYRTVRDSYLMLKQNEMFRKYANGSFEQLAYEIVRDPAMLRFLNNDRNIKRRPNENLARELMELFMLGEGEYSEGDIHEAARALTGNSYYDNDYVFNRRQHDDGGKMILGEKGKYDADGFVYLLLSQKACSEFICYKLYKHFAADVEREHLPDDAKWVIGDMAKVMRQRQYSIAATLKYLMLSEYFYNEQVVGRKIKSPTQLLVGCTRQLHPPGPDMLMISAGMELMGQRLFEPPSVAGWDGGRSWINTSTIFVRHNATTYLITGQQARNRKKVDNGYDPMFLVKGMDDRSSEAVVERLLKVLLSVGVDEQRKGQLVRLAGDGEINREKMVKLLLAITTMPEYQLC